MIRSPGSDVPIFNIDALEGIDIELGLSPEIAQIRGQTLGGLNALIGDVRGDISTLRGLENPFVQARVQPFVAEQERARRDAIRRGVAGPLTSLATNPFTARIAEEGARATFDAQQAILANQELIRGLLSDVSGQGRQLLEQELALLGLGQQEIRDIIASQLERPTTAGRTSEAREEEEALSGLFQIGGAIGGALAACWVAREVYGIQNPRWLEFKHWMLDDAPDWFRQLYLRHGERFAGWIRNKPAIKRLVRWSMEKVLNHGQRLH